MECIKNKEYEYYSEFYDAHEDITLIWHINGTYLGDDIFKATYVYKDDTEGNRVGMNCELEGEVFNDDTTIKEI